MSRIVLAFAFFASAALAPGAALGQTSPPQPPPGQGSSAAASGQGQASPTTQTPQSGSASQQVVVNPPNPPPPPPPAPPQGTGSSTTTVVNPPYAQYDGEGAVVVRREQLSPLSTVATDTAFGGLAGALVGTGIALINQWNAWGRDIMVGTGVGILVGAAVGGVHAWVNEQDTRRPRVAMDGLGTPDRDPPLAHARAALGFSGRF